MGQNVAKQGQRRPERAKRAQMRENGAKWPLTLILPDIQTNIND